MSRIPLTYTSIDETDWADAVVTKTEERFRFSWPIAGVTLEHQFDTKSGGDPKWLAYPDDIRAVESDLQTFDDMGLMVGKYAEFAVLESWLGEPHVRRAWTHLGNVEASIGDPTPLMQYVFGAVVYGNDVLGDWGGVQTIRLLGVTPGDVERRLLQALLSFRTRLDARIELFHLCEPEAEFPYDPETAGMPTEISAPEFCLTDMEPLQLYYQASLAPDDEYAFLQYYRVLEYYSVLQGADKLSNIRWDRAVSSTEFLRQATTAVLRDERSTLCELMARTTSTGALQRARDLGLARSQDPNVVANALYEFRNSVVHAKYDMRSTMHVRHFLREDEVVAKWKEVVRLAAADAMRALGASDS